MMHRPTRRHPSQRTGVLLRWIAGLVLALAAPWAWAQCGQSPLSIPTGAGALELAPQPWPIPVGKHFSVRLRWCGEGAAPTALKLDADMPAHRHGMNYQPTLSRVDTAGREWQADGLMFHMPGRWRFIVDVTQGSGAQRVTRELDVR